MINKEWDRAALLAEKYLDFETLVIICESTDNLQRLDSYMDRFSAEGFSEFLYSWYLKENKQGKLLKRYRKYGKAAINQKLTTFLTDHPMLFWMQSVFNKQYREAADTLKALANQETHSLIRQKTMFSLSKLAKIAEDNDCDVEFVNDINSCLELVALQEQIPDYVLQHYSYDTLHPSVISPKDMVHLYTCIEYTDAKELEFKKALDLLIYVDDDELTNELRLKIWSAAILRDTWTERSSDSPLEILKNKLFFKLADLALILGTYMW